MKDGEFKTVAAFSDRILAHIIAGRLNDNGIPAAVFGEISSYPSMNVIDNVEVKVNAADYDAAVRLLEETPSSESKIE